MEHEEKSAFLGLVKEINDFLQFSQKSQQIPEQKGPLKSARSDPAQSLKLEKSPRSPSRSTPCRLSHRGTASTKNAEGVFACPSRALDSQGTAASRDTKARQVNSLIKELINLSWR